MQCLVALNCSATLVDEKSNKRYNEVCNGENMSPRKILNEYGLKAKPLQDWIISKIDSEDVDENDLKSLVLLQDPKVAKKLINQGYSPYLEDYTWIGQLVNAIDIVTQRKYNPEEVKVPGWARKDDVLKKIYTKGVTIKPHVYWVKSKHVKKGKVLEPLDDIIPLVQLFEKEETKNLIKKYNRKPTISEYKTVGELNRLITDLYPPA